jgi:hypothetical protein
MMRTTLGGREEVAAEFVAGSRRASAKARRREGETERRGDGEKKRRGMGRRGMSDWRAGEWVGGF